MVFRICTLLLTTGWGRVAGLVLCLWLANPGCTGAQPAAFHFKHTHTRQARIPFVLQRNLIVIETWLNNQGPYNFLLDTGIGTSLITDPAVAQKLNISLQQRFLVAGAGEERPLEAFQTSGVAVRLVDEVEAPSLSFLTLSEDVLNLSGYVGMPIHGLLGSDVFRSFVVEVDPERQMVVLRDPARFEAPRGRRWARVPLDMEGRKAYLTVPVQLNDSLSMPLKLVLDTGAGHALSIETTSDARLRLPANRLRTPLGRGLSGNINGYLGRVAALQLGRYRMPSLITSFPDAADVAHRAETPRNGNLGFELLKRFKVIIDYTHNRLMLRPNNAYREPFEHDMSGVELLATGPAYRQFKITRIEPDSPAARAGLKPGDEFLSINLIPAEFFTLNQFSRMLHSEDGRQLLFVVRRADGELFTTTVRLKRQI
ncbi:aspartyl protease family protein [Hymenobacter pini]|uniref:aspartyl protease family protein n=1 Tax=Hymenobacter pini TaxID=2880879 RepID=UPI001CF4FD22|nr:aspartyl protease family protein [Hymenobacter pini]MCA8831014.1 aspartyl protease family protein [Hymenobacter pini]